MYVPCPPLTLLPQGRQNEERVYYAIPSNIHLHPEPSPTSHRFTIYLITQANLLSPRPPPNPLVLRPTPCILYLMIAQPHPKPLYLSLIVQNYRPSFFFFLFLGPHPKHIEVPRLRIQLELQLPACTTAVATPDGSHI